MSRYNSDAIDECCEEVTGHTNWSYAGYILLLYFIMMKRRKKSENIYSKNIFNTC